MTLERAGVPTATVISAPFAGKTRREAEVFGLADLPLVVVAHSGDDGVPIGQMSPDDVRRIAAASFQEIRGTLTLPTPAARAT